MRVLALALALSAVSASLAAVAGHAAAWSGRTTSEHIFTAFLNGKPAPGFHVSQSLRGYCWTGAEGSPRSDAWRCMAGNSILDPCFSDPDGLSGYVLCAETPFSKQLIRLNLTKKLPYAYGNKAGDPTRHDPWAIKLTNGATCVLSQGAGAMVAGMRVNYYCSNRGWLVGDPHRSSPTWKIFTTRNVSSSSGLTLTPIAQAWW